MNEFTIFNGTIWFSDADSVYKHLYPEHGFEVESLGVSDRFVSEDAFIAQRNLKDEYMRRDQKHSEIISELRKELKEKQDHIKTLEGRISNQKNMLNGIYGNMAAENITNSLLNIKLEKFEELENENKVLKARLKEAMLGKNILNQRKELRNLNKALERECKRNKELEELYSGAQSSVVMWKEKYNKLEAKYKSDSDALNARIKELRIRLKDNNERSDETCTKLLADLDHIAERCAKAEHTIDAIKEALSDGDYIFKEENNK